MLLTLFKLTMIVPLLSAICVTANPEKLSFQSEENKAVAQSHRQNSAFRKQDTKSIHREDSDLMQKRQLNKNNRFSDDEDSRVGRGSVHLSVENRYPRSGGLAHKMAKDALKSPKVQETIRKLSRVKSPKGSLRATVKVPGVTKGGSKVADERRHRKGARHKGRRKKKRKRHHRRFRNQHAGALKGGSSKRTSDNTRDTNVAFAKRSEGGDSTIKRNQLTLENESRHKSTASGSPGKITAAKVDDSDYVDFSSPLNTESSFLLTPSGKMGNSARLHERETMIERLMRTTTKDPLNKGPCDQGVDYSDYYSDDEVLQDIAANKIPMQLVETPNDRIARQALNFTSYREGSQIDRNVRPRSSDYDTHKRDLRYSGDSVISLNDYQNRPIQRSTALKRNSRLYGVDDPYSLNYGSQEYRNENFDTSNSDIPEQSQALEGNPVPELQNNLNVPNLNSFNGEIQQPEARNPEFNYMNQYEVPQDHLQSSSSDELKLPENINVNGAVEAADVPQSQNLDNQVENWPAGGNSDQNSMNRPQIDNMGISNIKEEEVEARTQPSYSPLQLYNTEGEQQEESLKSFPLQSKYNSPAANIANAMEQPLGKILESLGINVNEGANNFNQNPNLYENVDHQISPLSNTYDHPMEHYISPSYLKKKPKEDSSNYYEGNNAKGLEYQGTKFRNRNNIRDGYSRRQSMQTGGYNNDILTNVGEDKNLSHNMNISIAVHDTKEVANQILDTIMEELENLKEHKSKNKREGSWSTAQAGVKLDMRVVNRTIIVTVSDLVPQRLHESLLNGTWNVSGHVPFKRGSPFTLTATDNTTNSIAVFVGSCRVCQGIDTIAGVWSVARQPKGCKDFQVSTSVFNDIFRKSKLSSLKEKQNNSTENAAKHKKRKS